MKSNSSITTAELYPEHIQISILGINSDTNDSQSPSPDKIDSLPKTTLREGSCQSQLQAYFQQSLGLDVDLAYPTDLKFTPLVSQLVTGFVLTVATIRIAFIPSEDVGYDGFEIEQEWVDLSNWAADYYVPVQVDLEGKFLNLWGFISHRDVQAQGEFDRISRTYIIDSQYLSDELADLWLTCELIASGEMSPERGVVSPIPELLPQTAQGLIDTLRGHRSRSISGRESIFSPRLDLSFAQWGGILNHSKYLELYLQPTPLNITRLSDWLDRTSAAIYADWKSIHDFFKTPQLSESNRCLNLVEQLTICPQSNLMYRSIDSSPNTLAAIIENTQSQSERWDAIESLWAIDPNHSALPIYKLLDLGLFFQGEQLSLLVSIVPTKAGNLGILVRLSPNREQTKLPTCINLSLLAEDGQISREIIAQDGNYQCNTQWQPTN
jgi:Protein of unknown function (DUF1822)